MFAVVLARGSVLEGDRHHPGRHPAVDRRHRSRERRGAPDLRLERDRRRPRRCRHRHGHVRLRRDPAQPRDARRRATSCTAPSARLLPNRRGPAGNRPCRSCAARSSARCWACCRATAPCSARSPPTRSRRSSPKDPSRFGRGAIEGVAGPESANNAGAQTAFIPLLTLGIPPNAVMALMVGAMTIHGIVPGSADHDQAAAPVLGHDRLDVDRQSHAADHQPAADRACGCASSRCPIG